MSDRANEFMGYCDYINSSENRQGTAQAPVPSTSSLSGLQDLLDGLQEII